MTNKKDFNCGFITEKMERNRWSYASFFSHFELEAEEFKSRLSDITNAAYTKKILRKIEKNTQSEKRATKKKNKVTTEATKTIDNIITDIATKVNVPELKPNAVDDIEIPSTTEADSATIIEQLIEQEKLLAAQKYDIEESLQKIRTEHSKITENILKIKAEYNETIEKIKFLQKDLELNSTRLQESKAIYSEKMAINQMFAAQLEAIRQEIENKTSIHINIDSALNVTTDADDMSTVSQSISIDELIEIYPKIEELSYKQVKIINKIINIIVNNSSKKFNIVDESDSKISDIVNTIIDSLQ